MSNIQDVRGINNPQKSYEWEVDILGLSTGALRDMSFYAKTVNIPPSSIEQIVINHKSSRTAHAGRDASDHTVTMTFWDDENLTIYNYFQQWHDTLLRNPITGGGSSKDLYTADVLIKLLASDDETETARAKLSYAFPTELGEIPLSYDGSEPVEISVTMSFDEKIFTVS